MYNLKMSVSNNLFTKGIKINIVQTLHRKKKSDIFKDLTFSVTTFNLSTYLITGQVLISFSMLVSKFSEL